MALYTLVLLSETDQVYTLKSNDQFPVDRIKSLTWQAWKCKLMPAKAINTYNVLKLHRTIVQSQGHDTW